MSEKLMRVISLGAGVQSSYLALQCARGEMEPADHAVFADTGDEPAAVYTWLEWLRAEIARSPHPFPIHTVGAGRLSEASTRLHRSQRSGQTYLVSSVPVHVLNKDGTKGMWARQCTRNHKIDPINRKIRELARIPRGAKRPYAVCLVGISLDEAHRMKPARKPWVKNEWPLCDAGITRRRILEWFASMGYPQPPKSACTFCPYHSDHGWLQLKTNDPEAFASAVKYEQKLQDAFARATALSGVPFLHASLLPIYMVNFANSDQLELDGFGNECEGMCGL